MHTRKNMASDRESKPDSTKVSSGKTVKLKSGVTIDIEAKEHSGPLTAVKHKGDRDWCVVVIGGVTCVGVFHELLMGSRYELEGLFEENKKFNTWNFKTKSYKVEVDTTLGIKHLLLTECPGIGPSIANRLATRFQKETLNVIKDSPEKVVEFLKIKPEVASEMQKWAAGQAANLDIKQRLYRIGITPGQVSKLISEFGNNAEQKIKKDCFGMTKIKGFGFKTVAKIADLIGIPPDDKGRIKAALLYSIETLYDEGHTCLPCSDVVRTACELTGVVQEKILPVLEVMIKDKSIISNNQNWDECKSELSTL